MRAYIVLGYFVLFFIFVSVFASASLGIGPAKIEIDFEPNTQRNFNFAVSSDDPENNIKIYLAGDLASYATVSKQTLKGGGDFTVTLNFPESITNPGSNSLFVRAKEQSPPGEFLGAQIDIGAVIKVFVPYPGRYPVLTLDIPDGNIDEKIGVHFKVENKGSEDLRLNRVFIDFFFRNELVRTINFDAVQILSTEKKEFNEFFDTAGLRSGDFAATATINTGETWTVNDTFRVGSLFFNITNFTTKVPAGGIQRIFIEVESLWNNPLSGVYTDVLISNSSDGDISFRTASVDFLGWEKRTLEGYLDTTGLIGDYPIELTLHYSDKNSTVAGVLSVYSSRNYFFLIVVVAAIILAAVVILLYLHYRKRSNARGSKK